MNIAEQARNHVEQLAAKVARMLPTARLGRVTDETGYPCSSFTVALSGGLTLTVASDFDDPASSFLVMRTSGGPARALPFEDVFEDGNGATERLCMDGTLDLLRQYQALPPAQCGGQELRASSPSETQTSGPSPHLH